MQIASLLGNSNLRVPKIQVLLTLNYPLKSRKLLIWPTLSSTVTKVSCGERLFCTFVHIQVNNNNVYDVRWVPVCSRLVMHIIYKYS